MRSFGDSVEVSLFTLHRTSRLVSFWKKNRGRLRTICEAREACFAYRPVSSPILLPEGDQSARAVQCEQGDLHRIAEGSHFPLESHVLACLLLGSIGGCLSKTPGHYTSPSNQISEGCQQQKEKNEDNNPQNLITPYHENGKHKERADCSDGRRQDPQQKRRLTVTDSILKTSQLQLRSRARRSMQRLTKYGRPL